jgi:hypothetical protein
MLITVPENEVKTFSFFQQSGSRVWRVISMELNAPYYIMVHQRLEDLHYVMIRRLFWQIEDVLQVAKMIRADRKKAELYFGACTRLDE